MKFTFRLLGRVLFDFTVDYSDEYTDWTDEPDGILDADEEKPDVEFDQVQDGDDAPIFYDCSTCLDRLIEVKERLSDEDEEALRTIHKEVCPGTDPEPEPAK
nr:hypothetical protein [Rhodococcus sp. (in: high G+C Gram-positive bacteria)]